MSDVIAIHNLVQKRNELKNEIAKIIVGQDAVVDQILLCVFSGGHALLVGVPGLAKTLMVNTLAQALGLDFKRIQFTPDLMPSDILGSEILDENRQFRFIKGPIFSNIVLADEISPDTCRFWDSKTHEKLDKDRFRRDLGGVEDAYAEMMKRVGLD